MTDFIPFVNPKTYSPLIKVSDFYRDPKSNECFPIVNGIPRFANQSNYSSSFGFQWNKFQRTQLDSFSGSSISFERFYASTAWKQDVLSRSSVLEVGSGAGRFTEVFLQSTSGYLHSIDYSNAVEANLYNNAQYSNRLSLSQSSIYDLPFADNSFDFVFCLGVLQHTPSFQRSVSCLVAKAKVGGQIVVDFYPVKSWLTKLHSKYILRPVIRLLPHRLLLRIIRFNIIWMLPLFDALVFLNLGFLSRFLPITDIRCFPDGLSPKLRREWAVMDTFDAFSPQFDNPQRVCDVATFFRNSGCRIDFAGYVSFNGGSSPVVRATKIR